MDFIYPLLSVIGEVAGKTVDKLNYNQNKIKPGELVTLLFSTMIGSLLLLALFAHPFLPRLTIWFGCLMVVMIVVSFGQNFFDYVGLSSKNLSLREPINNLEPILASFLAYVLFPSERQIKYVVAIVIGVVILYWGNADKKLRLQLDKGTVYLFLGVVCSAISYSTYKLGLAEKVSPVYLLLIRTAGVLMLTRLLMRPNVASLDKRQVTWGIGSGFLYAISGLASLYSIQRLGLNFTILILLLGPGLIYICSSVVLKEKVLFKQLAASAALLFVIVLFSYL